jgi:hypothetical protein
VTAAEIKAALRRRHPAEMVGSMVGQWTCIEEWANVDLLALNAWRNADVIGYEVKVSRSDYRQELLAPQKRADAVAMCTEFYFAVPKGLLRPDELAFDEPDWQPEDWQRMRCPGVPRSGPPDRWELHRDEQRNLLDLPPGRYGGQCSGRGPAGSYKAGRREKGPFTVPLPLPLTPMDPPDYVTTQWQRIEGARRGGDYVSLEGAELVKELARWAEEHIRQQEAAVPCPTCGGKGYLAKSRVEAAAPTLWVPRDVGLIEVDGRGCTVTRRSPKRKDAPGLIDSDEDARTRRYRTAQLVRWTSNRPDPRHATSVHGQPLEAAA